MAKAPTAKLTLPKGKFAHELTAAPVDPTMKAAEATSAKLWRVPVSKIKRIPGFNVRVESPEYVAHRDMLQGLIETNGYDGTKPLAGYVAKDGDDNVIYVTDGHTRLDAVERINAGEGESIDSLPVLVSPKEVSLTDLTVRLHTANNGRPLTPLELGLVVRRLINDGGDKKSIAGQLGVTPRWLDEVLMLASADPKVKQAVAAGTVSSSFAITLLRKDADGAADAITNAAKKAPAGKKVTKKTVTKTRTVSATVEFNAGDDIKEVVKQAAAQIRNAVETEDGDDDTKVTVVAGSVTLSIALPATEKAEPAPKAPKAEKPAKKGKAKKAKAEPEPEVEAEPAPAKKKRRKGKKSAPVEGAVEVGNEGEDDEVAILPPKVETEDGDEDDVDI